MSRAFLSMPFKIDQRKQRSQTKLYQALVRAYQSGAAFDQIEIKAFCHSAGVSRATFYRHHQNLTDIIVVQFLILIADFKQQIDALAQVDFTSGSAVVVKLLTSNLTLMKLVWWSHSQAQIQALFCGTAQQVLSLRDVAQDHQQFVANFVGGAVFNFGQQLAQAQPALSLAEAQALYRLLMPAKL